MKDPNPTAPPTPSISDFVGWLFFALLCLTNGSTFLAMRLAVGPGRGFTPLWMAATRFTAAGGLLLAVLAVLGFGVRLPTRSLVAVLTSGALLCGGGTGFAAVASRAAGSGMVALFFALGPLWVAVLEALRTRRRPSLLSVAAMGLGAAGVGLLVLPGAASLPGDATTVAALLLGPVSYAAGSVVLKHAVRVDFWVAIAWQMLGGAAILWAALVATREPLPSPTLTAWGAWAYLTAVTSLVGFASFMIALRRLPSPVFMSHSWALPMVAATLGFLVLGESPSARTCQAAGLIIAGLVALVAAAARSAKTTAAAAGPAQPPVAEPGAGPRAPHTCSRPHFHEALRNAFSAWVS